jgi:hypothetical protein
MKAFMSDRPTRQAGSIDAGVLARCTNRDAKAILADRAVREAERILTETEAREFCHEYGTRFVADVPYYEAGFRVDLGLTLAFALADVLPVLDELAEDAARAMDAR